MWPLLVSATPKVREDKANNQEKQLLELFCWHVHGQFRTQVGQVATVHLDILDDIAYPRHPMYPCFLLQCQKLGVRTSLNSWDSTPFPELIWTHLGIDWPRDALSETKQSYPFRPQLGRLEERPKWAGKFEGKPTLHCRSVSSHPCGAKFQWPWSYDQDDEKTVTELRWILMNPENECKVDQSAPRWLCQIALGLVSRSSFQIMSWQIWIEGSGNPQHRPLRTLRGVHFGETTESKLKDCLSQVPGQTKQCYLGLNHTSPKTLGGWVNIIWASQLCLETLRRGIPSSCFTQKKPPQKARAV